MRQQSYPFTPGFRDTDTSMKAAVSMVPRQRALCQACVHYLRENGPATPDEVAKGLGESVLSIRPRITELKRLGMIGDTGQRRRNDSGRIAAVVGLT